MLTRENPFAAPTEANRPLAARAQNLFSGVRNFLANDNAEGLRGKLVFFFTQFFHDPLHVRLPFEERRLGLTLAALLSITLYVAFLAIAGGALFAHAASGMDREMARRVTFEILPASAQDKSTNERAALLTEKLQALPGVKNVARVSDEKMATLLSPWLGGTTAPADLPLPALVDVELNSKNPTGKELLARAAAGVPGVMMDDHAAFENALFRTARGFQFTALSVLLLGFAALILTAAFAAEAHFRINQDTIEILHLIGARDDAIARHMGLAVLRLSLGAAAAALLAAMLTVGMLHLCMRGLDISFFPNFAMGFWGFFGIAFEWVVAGILAAALCFMAAHRTVLRALQRMI